MVNLRDNIATQFSMVIVEVSHTHCYCENALIPSKRIRREEEEKNTGENGVYFDKQNVFVESWRA